MYKKRMKIIAIMLIFMLTITHLNVIGQVIAASEDVGISLYLEAEYESGYIVIHASADVYNGEMISAPIRIINPDYNVNKICAEVRNENNTIDTLEIAVPLKEIIKDEKVDIEKLKNTSVVLEITYRDNEGKVSTEGHARDIKNWQEYTDALLDFEVSKFIPYNINGNKGVVLQTKVQSKLKYSTLPIKETKISIDVPTINNVKPKEVKVTANTTKLTNGDETGINFTEENYTYDETSNELTITLKNEPNEQNQVVWNNYTKDLKDELLVNYNYPEEAFPQGDTNINITANSEINFYISNTTVGDRNNTKTVTLSNQISDLTNFSIKTEKAEISKGQIYANYDAQNKIETEYQETITANISLVELTDAISLEQETDKIILSDGTELNLAGSYYKTISLNKKEIDKILGENGEIKFYFGTTEIAKINKDIKANAEGKIVVNLSEANINNLKIETSKPIAEGNLNINIVKAIKGETDLTKAQIKNASKLKLNLTGKAVNGTETIVDQILTKEITFTEPTSQAELVIDSNKLSTVVTNENVKIKAILKTDTLNCKLYKNPTLQIILPNYIENINIKNIEVLFDTENSKLTFKSHQIVPNADGTKTILINLEGTQTEYTLGAVSKGVNVIITSDITVNKFTANKQDQIKMVYTNNDAINNLVETNEITSPINIVAPVGVITTNTIANYAENAENITSISGEEKTATIPILSEARNANVSMEVINNYNNTIDNISILGRTAFKGNKDIVSGANLGTTTNMPLTSNINVTGVDASKVTIYYSENGEATKDLSLASNGWTSTPTNLANVKSYLIVLTDYAMNTADRINFNYTMQIPANLQYSESAYENYVVYFNNNLETGTIQDKQVSTKVGLTTGSGAIVEASIASNKTETEEVLTGNIIKYALTVKNTGTETANNVIASINLPIELNYMEEQQDSNGYKTICFGGETANIEIGNIEPNQTVVKEINLKVGNLLYNEDKKVVEIKANVSASNISRQLETNTLSNTIAKTYYNVMASTRTNGKSVLKEQDTFTYYMEISSFSSYENQKGTVLEINIPTELKYKNVTIGEKQNNKETDITNADNINYDSKTRKLTIQLGDVEGLKTKIIKLEVEVEKLGENVYDKEVKLEATVSGNNTRAQAINVPSVQIGKVGLKVTQSSNIPENTHIAAYEDLKYVFTIENLSNIELHNVKFTDVLPKEFTLGNITSKNSTGDTKSSYENSINLTIKPKETITVEVNVVANVLEDTTKVTNKATIEYEGIDTIESSSYVHYIDKYDRAILDDPSYNPSTPENQTKRIMGTVWLDQNINGKRDEEETKMENVEMLLFNNQTGKLVANSTGNILKTTTDANGTYTFSGIEKGKYTVIFLYDTANYSATTYRKAGVDETINSDAVDSKITLDGVTRVAAITEEVVVTDSNIYNIDLGLVSNPKFDLKLDKTVSKITVQDATGTSEYEFNDSKLAKKDLIGKQIEGTTIIVEYKIKVTNEGAISGFVKKIADYMPSEMKFNSELNKDWYTSENGVLYTSSLANTIINPGESKEVTLILTKKMTEDNLGTYHNKAEIYEAYNDLGIEDVDSTPANKVSGEDDISSADVIITVKTGEVILFVGLSITIIATIGIAAYIIKKKVIK